MVEHLSRLIPGFCGTESCTQCFPHTVNLVAKVTITIFSVCKSQLTSDQLQAFLSFFYRQHPKAKTNKPDKPAKCGGHAKQPIPEESPGCGRNDPDLVVAPEPTHKELEMCEALEYEDLDDPEPVDAEKVAHDKQAVLTVQTEAVLIAKTEFGMELDSDEAQTAVGLLLKVWSILDAREFY